MSTHNGPLGMKPLEGGSGEDGFLRGGQCCVGISVRRADCVHCLSPCVDVS